MSRCTLGMRKVRGKGMIQREILEARDWKENARAGYRADAVASDKPMNGESGLMLLKVC